MKSKALATIGLFGLMTAEGACSAQTPRSSSLTPFDGAAETRLASPRVTVPLVKEGDFYFAGVAINGKPFKLTLETGANFVGISTRAATAAGLRVDSVDFSSTLGPQASRTAVAQIDSLSIGGVTYKGLVVRVSSMWDNAGFDGIISLPLFKDLLVTLDLPRSELVIEKGSLPAPNGRDILAFAGADRGERVDLAMTFGNVTVPAVIDTRSFIAIALPDSLEPRLSFRSTPVAFGEAAGPSLGRFRLRGARLDGNATIAGTVFRQPPVTLRDKGGPVVGVPILEHLTLTLDMKNKRARVVQSATGVIDLPKMSWEESAQASMGFNMAGFPGSNELRLLNIVPGSDAEKAGLKNDDVLVEFDGVVAADMNPTLFRAAIARGTPVKVVVMRDAKRLEFIVKPYTPR